MRCRTDKHIFPGHKAKQPLSLTALSKALKAAGGGKATVHGTARSTFKDWASERTSFPSEVSEMALAHSIGDRVEAAYRRGELPKKRAALMQQWATFLRSDGAGKVVSIGSRRRSAARPTIITRQLAPLAGRCRTMPTPRYGAAMRRPFVQLVAVLAIASPVADAFGQMGKPISVPSDPKARYWAVEGKRTSPTMVEILTKREGPSGTSYALRQIDCARRQFRYLGDGDTLAAAKNGTPSDRMGPLMAGSISTEVSDYACANVR